MATPAATPAAAPAPSSAPAPRAPCAATRSAARSAAWRPALAGRLGIDPLVVRLAFVLGTIAGGWGAALYLVLWAALPSADDAASAGRFRTGRSSVEVGLGAALLLLAAMLVARQTGLWWSDAVIWPVVLVAGGAALLWRQSLAGPDEAPAAAEAVAAPGPEAGRLRARRRAAVVSRTGLGVTLVLGAGVAILFSTGALGAARDVAVATVVVVVALAIIVAPFAARLLRSLADERATRIREQERAEVAAHLHDSVLQTLALMQQRADDPRQVATLARRQERELRAWLGRRPGDGTGAGGAPTLGAALEAVAGDVEATHRVPVEVVAVGEATLDEHGEALVAAAREAIVNAAKHGGGEPVRVFAEATPARRRGLRPRPRPRVRPRGGARRPARRPRVDRRADGRATAAPPRSTPSPASGPRSSSSCRGRRHERPRGPASSSSTTTASSAPACGPSSTGSSTSWARPRPSTRPSPSCSSSGPTSCSSTSTSPTGAASRCCAAAPSWGRAPASWPCRSATPPRTSSRSSAPARAGT